MKFSKILFLLVLTLSVISCKNNDDDTAAFNLSNANIAGTHDLTYFTSTVTTTGSIGGNTYSRRVGNIPSKRGRKHTGFYSEWKLA